MSQKISSDWELNAHNEHTCMHFTERCESDADDVDMMRRHLLLEVLDLLKIIEYTRGYDGIYYDITLRKR